MDAGAAEDFLPRPGASAQAGAFSWTDLRRAPLGRTAGTAVPTWFELVLVGMRADD